MFNVVLVDDEKTILSGLKNLINWSENNYHLTGIFTNPLEALDFCKKHKIDLLITDLMMPELNGIDLVKQLKQQQVDLQVLILSSYDDFHLVKDAFKEGAGDYILKPKLNAEVLLIALKSLSKKVAKTTELISLSKEEQLSQSLGHYLSELIPEFTFELNSFDHSLFFLIYEQATAETTKSFYHFFKTEKTQFSSSRLQCFYYKTNEQEQGILINTSSEEQFKQLITKFKLSAVSHKDYFFIYSEAFLLSDLRNVFLKLQKQSKGQSFYYRNQLIVSVDDLAPLLPRYDHNTNKYLTTIVNKDYLSSITELQNYMQLLTSLKLNPTYLKHEAINQFYALISVLEDDYEKDNTVTLLKDTVPKLISKSRSLDEFTEFVMTTIEQLKKIIAPTKGNNSEVLTLVYQFIQENYNQEINLQMISEKYHFSYGYLSTIFTEKYGLSFSKYLKKVRITKAKEYLVHSTLSLSEICYEIGYTELGYFSRVFKEETGITPSQYRKGRLKK
ncbi:response regulator transcription factor [Enterococcus sp. LJL99]